MLKRDQIVPYLDAYMRSFRDGITNQARAYVKISTCHRVIANGLLLHHYKGYGLISVKTVVRRSPFSEETTRRAIRMASIWESLMKSRTQQIDVKKEYGHRSY